MFYALAPMAFRYDVQPSIPRSPSLLKPVLLQLAAIAGAITLVFAANVLAPGAYASFGL